MELLRIRTIINQSLKNVRQSQCPPGKEATVTEAMKFLKII